MEYRSSLPMFYQRPVPLNSELHAGLSIGKSPTLFAFAAASHSVVLAVAEFMDACRYFPILFTAAGQSPVMPLALLGVRHGENLFVGKAGEWQAGYIPAYVRRYPFISSAGAKEQAAVYIDEAYDGLNAAGGEALFAAGSPSAFLQGMLEFMNRFQQQINNTETLCRQIDELGLFKPVSMKVVLRSGKQINLTDFRVMDEQRLALIGADAREGLFLSGALAMIHAHLISLRTMDELVARAEAR